MNSIMIWDFYILQNDYHNKSSYHLSPHRDITLLLTIFYLVYISALWLIYFVMEMYTSAGEDSWESLGLFFQNFFMYIYHPYFFHGEMSI